jgi:hypothetical protein
MGIKEVYAHNEEVHETATEASVHYFEFLLEPVFAISLFLLLLISVIALFKVLKFSISQTILSVTVLCFIAGVLGFMFVPPLGVLSITLGFILALLLALTGIRKT